MRKKIMLALAIFAGIVILVEAVALLILYRNVARYHAYWPVRARQAGELTYVALGDSAAQGLGASNPENGYVGLIAKKYAESTGKSVRVVNVSRSGAKINDVLRTQLSAIKDIKPDLVTIEIGANDIATFTDKTFREEFTTLVGKLPKNTYVANMPYFGSRPSRRPKAYEATKIINSIVPTRPDLQLVDLQTITKERDNILGYAADYFHPNNRSYKNWAEAFWNEISKDQ